MEFIPAQLQPSPMTMAIVVCTISALWWMDRGAVLRGNGGGWAADKLFRTIFLAVYSSVFFLPVWRLVLPPQLLLVVLAFYLPSYLNGCEQREGRNSMHVQTHWIWHWLKRRMNLKLHFEEELDPAKKYVFGVHPHSILPWGSIVNLLTDVNNKESNGFHDKFSFTQLHAGGASVCFCIPVYRELCLAGGCIEATRPVMDKALEQGKSIMIVVGGAAEAMHAFPGTNTLILKKRYGFVAMAIRNGADLVPVYSFGETDAYDQVDLSRVPVIGSLRERWTRIFGTTLPMVTNIIPLKCDCTTHVGRPIPVERDPDPSPEKVEALLQIYMAEIQRIFDE
eukprot:CAMPEP_0180316140 /NCGR_PEP_ID=MMETSP0988-20121125/33075_1 /TAXON_ID=697907 /ORGANISM="non described non described, Strain CCMP2293" /LENGTH=336 /DNA_ID=CAMNT_0022301169 /DNA_START=94 /DNA_END=1101 /DNA_ORIENTATION=+